MLTDTAIRSAKRREKPYKLADEKGLYLLVNGIGKYFRFDYRFAGKRRTLALGVYPDVTLAGARAGLERARSLLKGGIYPGEHRKATKAMQAERAANSFEAVAREWHVKQKAAWTEGYAEIILRRLETDVFPWLGGRPAVEITSPELLAVLRRIESRGAIETAHRIKQICGQVFRYAIVTGRAERDPSGDLRGALTPTKPKSMAAITNPKQVGELMRAMDGYQRHLITKSALRLAPLIFVRPGELRHAEWKIPAEKMKMRSAYVVPLSRQAMEILQELAPLTGGGRYVFPSLRTGERPMSENTVLAALRRMGYAKDEMTGHGFRSMASTLLHEQGWPSDAIERQLAHKERNSIKAAYNHAQHLPERRRMMQAWADYLDSLRAGGGVISFRAAARGKRSARGGYFA